MHRVGQFNQHLPIVACGEWFDGGGEMFDDAIEAHPRHQLETGESITERVANHFEQLDGIARPLECDQSGAGSLRLRVEFQYRCCDDAERAFRAHQQML